MINLELLSKYRTQLMGLAIIGVVIYHSSFPFEYYSLLGFLSNNGYAGVEVFFLLSGFGIYFSISKSTSIKEFYKKRALRILPYYLPIVLLFSIMCISVGYWKIDNLIYNMLTIGYWMNLGFSSIFDWYIPALIVVYLITPWFYALYKKNKAIALFIFCAFPISLIICNIWIVNINVEYLYLVLYRAPLYFIGFAIADFLKAHKDYKFSIPSIIFFLIISISALAVMMYLYFTTSDWEEFTKNGRQMLFCFIIVFPFCLFISYLLSLVKNYKYPILTFFGTYTLSIYIFHERIIKINLYWFGKIIDTYDESNIIYVVLFKITVIIVALFLAVWWQKTIDKLVHKLENK